MDFEAWNTRHERFERGNGRAIEGKTGGGRQLVLVMVMGMGMGMGVLLPRFRTILEG